MFTFEIDTPALHELAAAMDSAPQRFHAAVARSLNRAAESAAVAVSRELAHETGAGVRAVRREVTVTKHAVAEDLAAEITISGDALPLSAFAPRDVAAGVSVRTWEGQREILRGLFHIPKAGPHHWFTRVGRERLPIEEVTSEIERAELVTREGIVKLAEETAERVFEERIEGELGRMLAIGAATRTFSDGEPGA